MPTLEASSSHEDEDEIGSLVDVIVQLWMAMERDDRVVVMTWATGEDFDSIWGGSVDVAEG